MSKENGKKVIIGGAIGNCVHVAGVYEYLRIAESFGYHTIFLGAAVEPRTFVQAVKKNNANIICISYRLTPGNLNGILKIFFNEISKENLGKGRIFYFGGTPPCIEVAKKFTQFSHFFQGEEPFSEICETLFIQSQIKAGNYGIYERLPISTRNTVPQFNEKNCH